MEINIGQVLFQALNFGVILFVLTKFLYKPLMKLLDERAKKINDGLAAAEKNMASAAEAEKSVKAELAKAKKMGTTIISDAEKEAKVKGDKIIEDAKAKAKGEASKIIADAHATVEAFDKKLQTEATKVATRLIKEALKKLPAKDAEKITSSIIAEL